ncbi:PTS glucitol/sorbitol transporter subunit IIB [Raoultella ornithinolytica]|uniref:PTS glucitol/sorbitol transporter subunit IIB n=1 Tax=Enterobacteriaceae TaxID=543 RepID=UPI0019000F53|nr:MULTISPECIES: PTS glucitol/sorbitol transporter subunit IIB [Enterobacteriaceae]MBJ8377485.1 PTS glucitol/sorbitol transporter subunit IIB [Citrobacter cronae]MDV0591591.1 PTS glucitol/sorbitol transporter subunit IIB [Raoultella ornithinolytica]HAT1561806.1 PTS glucitol/sorbitol transporter subunit IIB [Raoultella ornithinolytica]HDT6530078.1 PTS glucitol/sorbitol transporter subunit IIB [Raoultella ornithinolytica]
MELIHITPGPGGSGTGFWLPLRSNRVILCLTGGDFHPVAIELAALTESELVNGYSTLPPDEQLLCVVLDDTSSLLCGLYSQKHIPVINVRPGHYNGHLANFITDATYVSGVTLSEIARADIHTVPDPVSSPIRESGPAIRHSPPAPRGIKCLAAGEVRLALWVGEVLPLLRDAAREAIQVSLRDILPFMALIALLMALAENSTLGAAMEHLLAPLMGSVWGLLLLSAICSFPFLSPLLGPGAAFTQVAGVIIGTQIGAGTLPPALALPALFAINVQVGCDFIPVGLAIQGANRATIAAGVPAFLLSRQLTGPLAVIIGWLCATGLFT